MEAASGIWAGLYAIGRLANLNFDPIAATKEFTERAPAIARVHIIADGETIKKMSAILRALDAAFMHMNAERMRGMGLKSQLDVVNRQFDQIVRDQQRSIELMKEENYKGRPDAVRWSAIQRNYEFETEQGALFLQKQTRLQSELFDEQMSLSAAAISLIMDINTKLPAAIVAVRNELALPIPSDVMTSVVASVNEQTREDFDRFNRRVRENAEKNQ